MDPPLRVRRSMNDIWADYQQGIAELDEDEKAELQKPLIDLIRAWKGIQDLSRRLPNHPHSFFRIAGFHGSPFRGAGYANPEWWGGYCNHGNVLFPTWHRAYTYRLEEALRSVKGCKDVTIPYLDESGQDFRENGLPSIFHEPNFELDGEVIDNPLYSYEIPLNITDHITKDPKDLYTKKRGYKTVRYPRSGLVGTHETRAITQTHNNQFTVEQAADHLNDNLMNWLGQSITIKGVKHPTGTRRKFWDCLRAPNYTVFSNTTSAQAWNDIHADTKDSYVWSIESPHNDMHLALGGFELPGKTVFSAFPGANGDMGENDTAAFDPVFFFHHCEIDRLFWMWQKRFQNTDSLSIIPQFAGTNSVDEQGPTPGVAGGTWLTLDSPLEPFVNPATKTFYTSHEIVNIETQCGYTYDPPRGSVEDDDLPPPLDSDSSSSDSDSSGSHDSDPPTPTEPQALVRVTGVNKHRIAGSHMLEVWATLPPGRKKDRHLLAVESVLSRWNQSECAGCQINGIQTRYIPLYGISHGDVQAGNVKIEVEVCVRPGNDPKQRGNNKYYRTKNLKAEFEIIDKLENEGDTLRADSDEDTMDLS